MPRLILASGSPRRASVLHQLGLEFEIRVTDVDESVEEGEAPAALAERLARAKAAAGEEPGSLAFGFDTIVAHRGEILGKPGSSGEAVQMVERLAGETHEVFSGIAVAADGRVRSAVERTTVRFRDIRPGEAASYVATGEPLDKAGAYGIQGVGAVLVTSVEGDFFNVMGFPIQRFQELLKECGWRYHFGTLVAGDDGAAGFDS
jgi:septum formation protein